MLNYICVWSQIPTGDRSASNYAHRRGGARYSDKYPRCTDSFKVSGDLAFTLEDIRTRVSANEIITRQKQEREDALKTAIIHDVPIEVVHEENATRYAKFREAGQEVDEINAEVDLLLASRGRKTGPHKPLAFSKAPTVSRNGWGITTKDCDRH